MPVIRAFIAIELSPEIQRRLAGVIEELKKRLPGAPVRWVPAENIHLTLKFLGDVSLANLEMLKEALRSEVSGHPGFEMSVGSLGAFPSIHRPRVVWVGVQAPAGLAAVQKAIDDGTARLGYESEERPFSPHLTLGRVGRSASPQDVQRIGSVLDSYSVGELGKMRAQAVYLFKSDLTPGGSIYTRLYSVPFSARPA